MPGARSARQRTAAQRKARPEDARAGEEEGFGRFDEDATAPDVPEQAAEIRLLRKQNDAQNELAQNGLDIGVLLVLFITGAHFLQQLETPSLLSLLSGLQTILLPFSLTPYYLPLFRPLTSRYHPHIALAHLTVFFLAFQQVRRTAPLSEIVRWALPELMAGAVEMQRRSEREAERKLRMLEGLQYDVPGA